MAKCSARLMPTMMPTQVIVLMAIVALGGIAVATIQTSMASIYRLE